MNIEKLIDRLQQRCPHRVSWDVMFGDRLCHVTSNSIDGGNNRSLTIHFPQIFNGGVYPESLFEIIEIEALALYIIKAYEN